MKRSRHENEKIGTTVTTTKSELTTPAKKSKVVEVSVFDWLPDEIVEMILKQVPWELDRITRLVRRRWHGCISHRWDPKRRIPETTMEPSAPWAVYNHVFSLAKWLVIMYQRSSFLPCWMRMACHAGNTRFIAWLASNEPPLIVQENPRSRELNIVARHGDLDCYRRVLKLTGMRCPHRKDVYEACLGGRWKTVKWIMEKYSVDANAENELFAKDPMFWVCLVNACRGGHIPMADWLLTYPGEGFCGGRNEGNLYDFEPSYPGDQQCMDTIDVATHCMIEAIKEDHLALVKHLVVSWNFKLDDTEFFKQAMKHSSLDMIQWVFGEAPDENLETLELDEYFLNKLIAARRFEALDICFKRFNFSITTNMFRHAIKGDKEDVLMLQWLWDRCDQTEIKKAFLEYTRNDNVNEDLFRHIVSEGCPNSLQWLQDHGVVLIWPWKDRVNVYMFFCAVGNSDHGLAMVQWLWQHCNDVVKTKEAIWNYTEVGDCCNMIYMRAIRMGNMSVLNWLQDHGMGWEEGKMIKGKVMQLHFLRLHLHGMVSARGRKDLSVAGFRWLHQRGLMDLSKARILLNGEVYFHFQYTPEPGDYMHGDEAFCMDCETGGRYECISLLDDGKNTVRCGKYLISRTNTNK